MTFLGQHSFTCSEEIIPLSPLRQRLGRGANKEPSTWQTEAALEMLHNQNAFPPLWKAEMEGECQEGRGEWGHSLAGRRERTAFLRVQPFLGAGTFFIGGPGSPLLTHSLSSVRARVLCYFMITRKRRSKCPCLCAETSSFSRVLEACRYDLLRLFRLTEMRPCPELLSREPGSP